MYKDSKFKPSRQYYIDNIIYYTFQGEDKRCT